MSKPPSYEFTTLTVLDNLPADDDSEVVEISSGVGLHPGEETTARAPSPMPGSLDPDSAIDRTTPTPGIIPYILLTVVLHYWSFV